MNGDTTEEKTKESENKKEARAALATLHVRAALARLLGSVCVYSSVCALCVGSRQKHRRRGAEGTPGPQDPRGRRLLHLGGLGSFRVLVVLPHMQGALLLGGLGVERESRERTKEAS